MPTKAQQRILDAIKKYGHAGQVGGPGYSSFEEYQASNDDDYPRYYGSLARAFDNLVKAGLIIKINNRYEVKKD